MKSKQLIMVGLCSISIGLLSGCTTSGGPCGGYCGYYGYNSYNSQCGLSSCTDNTYIVEYSNPCPGAYGCYN